MKVKRLSQMLFFTLLMSATTMSFAARQGVDFFYGIGLNATYIDQTAPQTEYDVAGGGEFIAGFEEDGWALEYIAYHTIEAETSIVNLEYKLKGSATSLSYRTAESGGIYYKFRYGEFDTDALWSTNTTTAIDGQSYGLGIGFRLEKEKRIELEYTFVSADSSSGFPDAHMLSLRYLFGGNPGRVGL
ncbi:MAG: hypothetical protein OEZ38_14180 [Gammaproteobacteria bacterium]|nr:hypothetical protein [Gammaproteobacteria bacterium]